MYTFIYVYTYRQSDERERPKEKKKQPQNTQFTIENWKTKRQIENKSNLLQWANTIVALIFSFLLLVTMIGAGVGLKQCDRYLYIPVSNSTMLFSAFGKCLHREKEIERKVIVLCLGGLIVEHRLVPTK